VTRARTRERREGRARPLPPDERRAAIVKDVVPVVRQYGANATTRQLADAAGVAEGTLFRAFKDKDAILAAVVEHVIDPEPWVQSVAGIDPRLPLRDRLGAAVKVLQERMADVFAVMIMIGRSQPDRANDLRRPRQPSANDPIMDAVLDLLRPDADSFRVDVAEVGRYLRLLIFAGTHVWITDHHPMTPDEIVGLILDGVLSQPDRTDTDELVDVILDEALHHPAFTETRGA
jgi:AcrR family transcriptional regulator